MKKQRVLGGGHLITHAISSTTEQVVYITAAHLFNTYIPVPGGAPSGVCLAQTMLLRTPVVTSIALPEKRISSRELHVVCIPVRWIYNTFKDTHFRDVEYVEYLRSIDIPQTANSKAVFDYNEEHIRKYVRIDSVSLADDFIMVDYHTFRTVAESVFKKNGPAQDVPEKIKPCICMCRESLDIPAHRLHIATLLTTKKLVHLQDFFTVARNTEKGGYICIKSYSIYKILYLTLPVEKKGGNENTPKTLPPLPFHIYPEPPSKDNCQQETETSPEKFQWRFPLTFK